MWLKCEVIQRSDKAMKIIAEYTELWVPYSCVHQEKKGFVDIVDWKYDQIIEELYE